MYQKDPKSCWRGWALQILQVAFSRKDSKENALVLSTHPMLAMWDPRANLQHPPDLSSKAPQKL
jgi:hypothetical protein